MHLSRDSQAHMRADLRYHRITTMLRLLPLSALLFVTACTPAAHSLDPAQREELAEATAMMREAAAELQAATVELKAATEQLQQANDRARRPHPVPTAPTLGLVDRTIPGTETGITCTDENHCTVKKDFLEEVLANPAQLARQARIVPAIRDGRSHGYKLYGIRPGSLPKAFGLKNGDLITHVNGHALDSIDRALDLYTKLRTQTKFEITTQRRDQTRVLHIEIR